MTNRDSANLQLQLIAARVMARLEKDKAAVRERIKKNPVNPFTLKPLEPDEVQLDVPAGASDYQVRKLSKKLGVKIPDDLKMWLKLTNGLSGFFGIDTPKDFDNTLWQVKEYYPSWPSRGLIPVAKDECGCTYAVSLEFQSTLGSAIVFMDLAGDDSEPRYVVASNMISFVEIQLFEDEIPPTSTFQEIGEWLAANKEYVLSKDPAIVSVKGIPCLWET